MQSSNIDNFKQGLILMSVRVRYTEGIQIS